MSRTVTITNYDRNGQQVGVDQVELPDDLPPDIVAIANDLTTQRARLEAAEDALFFLITDSLGGI